MNITVSFNDVGEFANELKRAMDVIEMSVRLTGSYRQTGALPISNLFLVGSFFETFRDGTVKLVKLESFCGQIMRNEKDSAAQKLYELRLQELEKIAEEEGVKVLPGIYNFPEAK